MSVSYEPGPRPLLTAEQNDRVSWPISASLPHTLESILFTIAFANRLGAFLSSSLVKTLNIFTIIVTVYLSSNSQVLKDRNHIAVGACKSIRKHELGGFISQVGINLLQCLD